MKVFKVRITFRRIITKNSKYFVSNLLNWDMLILSLYKRCVIGMEKDNLFKMDQRGVYYIPRLKLNNRIYVKNEFPEYFRNGTIKKQYQYIKVDLEHIMDTLKPGQSYEIKEAYFGKDKKLFTRVIMYRLTEKQLRERMKKQVYTESTLCFHF